jgi:MYXO-CTERM domain-containing protein
VSVAASILVAVVVASAAGAARLVDVRVGRHSAYTRIVLETDGPVTHRLEESQGGILVVNLDAAAQGRSVDAKKSPDLAGVTVAAGEAGKSQVKLSLRRKVDVKTMVLTKPNRIVLDLYAAKSAATPPPVKKAAKAAKAAPAPPPKVAEPKAKADLSSSAPAAREGASAPPGSEAKAAQVARVEDSPARPPGFGEDLPAPEPVALPDDVTSKARAETAPMAPLGASDAPSGAEAAPERRPKTRSAPPPPPASESGSGQSGGRLVWIGLAALLAVGVAFVLRRRRSEDDSYAPFDQDEPFSLDEDSSEVGEVAEVVEDDRESGLTWEASSPTEGDEEEFPALRAQDESPAIDSESGTQSVAPGASAGEPLSAPMGEPLEKEPMEQEAYVSPEAQVPPVIAPAAEAGSRVVEELERRLAHLETRLEEVVDAKERLERHVAAQTEELRVQRAAIARTQRVLRSLTRPEEDSDGAKP